MAKPGLEPPAFPLALKLCVSAAFRRVADALHDHGSGKPLIDARSFAYFCIQISAARYSAWADLLSFLRTSPTAARVPLRGGSSEMIRRGCAHGWVDDARWDFFSGKSGEKLSGLARVRLLPAVGASEPSRAMANREMDIGFGP